MFTFYYLVTSTGNADADNICYFAKRYKLRERERHVNIQAIVEEHYEKYLHQEEEYMREAANMYNN